MFASMDEQLIDAICERLQPTLFTPGTDVMQEGDRVNEMLFIVQGSAADVAMLAMLEIARNTELKRLGWRLLLQVIRFVIGGNPLKKCKMT